MKKRITHGLHITLEDCPEGGDHLDVTEIKPVVREEYVADDEDETSSGNATVGAGSRLYEENWDRMWGDRDVSPENMN